MPFAILQNIDGTARLAAVHADEWAGESKCRMMIDEFVGETARLVVADVSKAVRGHEAMY